jgi:hypothetical protein
MSCLLTLNIAFGMLLLVESIGRFHTKFKMMTFGAKMMEDLPLKHVWRSPLLHVLCFFVGGKSYKCFGYTRAEVVQTDTALINLLV